jgi:hypothetical protein
LSESCETFSNLINFETIAALSNDTHDSALTRAYRHATALTPVHANQKMKSHSKVDEKISKRGFSVLASAETPTRKSKMSLRRNQCKIKLRNQKKAS